MKEKVSKIMKTVIALMLAVILAVPAIPKTAEAASKPSAPAITKVVNASSGVAVTWKKVSSASGYYVYRKTSSGSYTKIATIKKNSTVTYTDKKASAGKTYTYAVKAYNSKGTSGYGTAKAIKRLTQPSVKVANTSSGIKISWGKVSGASKYRVYYKKSGKWVKLADTSSTSYTDKSVKSGSSRTYTVKAISGSYSSSYVSGKTMKRLSQPSVKVANTSSGIKVSWGKVTGASKYRIYYKKSGKWVKLTDTTSTSYIDKSVKSGSSRTYTVRAYSGSYSSSYISGVTATHKHTHSYTEKITKAATCTADGVKTYTCACGSTYTKAIPKTGHSYTSTVTKAATCTADGVRTYTCKNCGHSYTETIPAAGHKYESKVTKAATCEEDGIRTYTCKSCGDSYTETIPALGHDWEDLIETKTTTEKVWVVDQEAYDEEVTTYKYFYECTGCGERFYYEKGNEESGDLASDAVSEHLFECTSGTASYTAKKEAVTEIVHHDEEGHYEEKTVTETVVIGRKCKRCGLEELN